MKFSILILATFVLFLAIKPGVDLFSSKKAIYKTCCGDSCVPSSDSENSNTQNRDNDCNGEPCNPFQVCSTCTLASINFPLYIFVNFSTFSKNEFNSTTLITKQFNPDFWQPPKIV